jgi:hypothetical protein
MDAYKFLFKEKKWHSAPNAAATSPIMLDFAPAAANR